MEKFKEAELQLALTSAATIQPAPQSECLAVLADWLNVYADLRDREMGELAQLGYREALKDVPAMLLHKAFLRCLKTIKWIPMPADVLEAVEIERENAPAPKPIECERCAGTGYKVVPRPNSCGVWAVKCDHKI